MATFLRLDGRETIPPLRLLLLLAMLVAVSAGDNPYLTLLVGSALEGVANQDFASAVPRFYQAAALTSHDPLSPEQYLSSQNLNQLYTHACSHGIDSTYEPDAWCLAKASRESSLHFAGVANSAVCSNSKCGLWAIDYDESRQLLIAGLRRTASLFVNLSGILDSCREKASPALWRRSSPRILAASELRWRGDVDVEQEMQAVQEQADKHVTASARKIRERWEASAFNFLNGGRRSSSSSSGDSGGWTVPQLRALKAADQACDDLISKGLPGGLIESRSLLHRLFQNLELAFSFNTVYSDTPAAFLPLLASLLNAPWPSEPADAYQRDLTPLFHQGGKAAIVPKGPRTEELRRQAVNAASKALGATTNSAATARSSSSLRVGIFSPDFRRHPVGFSIQGLLPAFDSLLSRRNDGGALWCFSTGPHDSRLREVFEPPQLQQARKQGFPQVSTAQRVWAELHGWRELANAELQGSAASRKHLPLSHPFPRVPGHPYPQMGLGERLQGYMHSTSLRLEKSCSRFQYLHEALQGLKTGKEEGVLLSVLRHGPKSDGTVYSPAEASALSATRGFGSGPHVLLDLAGLTAGGRPNVMARRVAPLQLHYMGSPVPPPIKHATDWYVADAVALPPEAIYKTSPVLTQGRLGGAVARVARKAHKRWTKGLADGDTALELAHALTRGGEKAHQGVMFLPPPYHCSALFIPRSVLESRPIPAQRWQEVQASAKRLLLALHAAAEEDELQRRPEITLPLTEAPEVPSPAFAASSAFFASSEKKEALSSHPSRLPTVHSLVVSAFRHALLQRQEGDVWIAAPLSASSVKRDPRTWASWTAAMAAASHTTKSFLVLIAPPNAWLEAWKAEYSAVVRQHLLKESPLLDGPLPFNVTAASEMLGRDISSLSFCPSPSFKSTLVSTYNPVSGLPKPFLSDSEFHRHVFSARGAAHRLIEEAAARGIHRSRILILPDLPRELLPDLYALFDLSLDTRIYGGHSTTADALSHGLPVLTVPGDHIASRLTASFLRGIEEQERLAMTVLRDQDRSHNKRKGQEEEKEEASLSTLLITKNLADYQQALEALILKPHTLLLGLRDRLHRALRRINDADIAADGPSVHKALVLPAPLGLNTTTTREKAGEEPLALVPLYSPVAMLDFNTTAVNLLRGTKAALETRALQQVLAESFRGFAGGGCPLPFLCGQQDIQGENDDDATTRLLPSPPHIVVV